MHSGRKKRKAKKWKARNFLAKGTREKSISTAGLRGGKKGRKREAKGKVKSQDKKGNAEKGRRKPRDKA